MANIQDIKKEYGLILRWINPSEIDGVASGAFIWFENTNIDSDDENIWIMNNNEVVNQEAVDFIKKVTVNGFRDKTSIDCYDNYINLFETMGITPLLTLKDLTDKNQSQISRETGISRETIRDIFNGKTNFSKVGLYNAMKIAKVLGFESADALFYKLYSRI